jgi:hypothetical protein
MASSDHKGRYAASFDGFWVYGDRRVHGSGALL